MEKFWAKHKSSKNENVQQVQFIQGLGNYEWFNIETAEGQVQVKTRKIRGSSKNQAPIEKDKVFQILPDIQPIQTLQSLKIVQRLIELGRTPILLLCGGCKMKRLKFN
jgi:hypothetical protein